MNKRLVIITYLVLLAPVRIAGAAEPADKERPDIRVTVLYDNYSFAKGPKTDWGFSCLLTGTEKTILFDTGTKPDLLVENMEKLNVDPENVEIVVISHDHGDHTGGLLALLAKNGNVSVYLPPSCKEPFVEKIKNTGAQVVIADAPAKICAGVHLTGPMGTRIMEQSMIVDTADGAVVITGCAHPGIVEIVRESRAILGKDIRLVFGGFHLPRKSEAELRQIIGEFRKLGVQQVGPTHCTGDRAIRIFKQAYGSDFVQMGVGRTLKTEAPAK